MTLKSDSKFEKKRNFLFQKWQEFGEFWSEHSKFSKICTLIGYFCAKCITLTQKSIEDLSFMTLKSDAKFDLRFGKWHEEYGKFSPKQLKVSKLGLWWDPLFQIRKCMSLKFTEELYVMTMKNDEKCEEEFTCRFKNDIKNLANFHPGTRKSQKSFTLMSSFWAKHELFELKTYRRVTVYDTEE